MSSKKANTLEENKDLIIVCIQVFLQKLL